LLNQAKAAARGAADRLRIYKSKSRMGFIRQREDGSTSLGFLTGGSGMVSGERPISLGALIGRVKQVKILLYYKKSNF
jgi:bromodomain-containing protein 7/9